MKTLLTTAFLFLLATIVFAGNPQKELYEGISKGNLERIKKAVADGADVNKKVSNELPLHWALSTTHRESV